MKKSDFERLEKLEKAYQHARCVCDPIDYQYRMAGLLIAIVEHLLEPYRLEIEKRKKDKRRIG